MTERTRVAIVGAGEWGLQHARVFAARSDVEICAIAGRTPARAEARASQFGTSAYTDLRRMLEEQRPDLVAVCLPNADSLLEEAARRRLFFAINFNHRYARPVQLAAEAIRSGELGALVFATWRFGGEAGTSAHPHANLIETQCHGFDMLEHLCGPIDAVSAEMTGLTGRGWSTVAAALHFASGAVGTLLGTYDSSYAYPGTHLLEVNGTAGRVLVEDTVRRFTFSRAGDETSQVWQAGYFNDLDREFHRTFDRHVDALLPALREGRDPPVPASAGRRALAVAQAAIRSFESGMRVAVPA